MAGHMHRHTPAADTLAFSSLALTQSANFNLVTSRSGIAARVTSHPTLCNANALMGKSVALT